MVNALVQIIAEAKRIQKAHPSMQWKTAVKGASAKYRASHGTKKKTGTKKRKAKKSKK
jgi:hypothetical protein